MDSGQQKVSLIYLFMERNKVGTGFRFPEFSKPGTECPPLISKLHFPIDGFHCIGPERSAIPGKAIGVEKIPAFGLAADGFGDQSASDGRCVGAMPSKTGASP